MLPHMKRKELFNVQNMGSCYSNSYNTYTHLKNIKYQNMRDKEKKT